MGGKNGFLFVDLEDKTAVRVDAEIGSPKDAYAGAVVGKDGMIYCIPAWGTKVGRIDPTTNTMTTFGDDLGSGPWKYNSGICASDGKIWCAPNSDDCTKILCIDPQKQSTERFDAVKDPIGKGKRGHGGGVFEGEDGRIFFMPFWAMPDMDYSVLVFDPKTKELPVHLLVPKHFEHSTGRRNGYHAWYGGVEGQDHIVYCIPCCSDRILAFNLSKDLEDDKRMAILCNVEVPANKDFMWFGGALGCDGLIYCAPHNSTSVLVINPLSQSTHTLPLPMSKDETGWGKGAYRGAVASPAGTIYCIPCQAGSILVISPPTGSILRSFQRMLGAPNADRVAKALPR
jgi:streptogramin lyase